jgi:hypothetical protein
MSMSVMPAAKRVVNVVVKISRMSGSKIMYVLCKKSSKVGSKDQ